MAKRNFYYARVSTILQNEDRQLDAISGIEIDERDIYIDKASGKDFDRPEWNALKRSIRSGDTLVVKSIDRMGRKKSEILEQWRWLVENGIDIVVLDMPILDTRRYKELNGIGEMISELVLQLLSFMAEEERLRILKNQAEGFKAAKLRGIRFGRPKIKIDNEFKVNYNRWKSGEITATKAMELAGVKRNTFYRHVAELEGRI